MSNQAEQELIDLVSSEQRSLRGILVAGFSALFLVVAMSVALGVYYFFVAQNLAEDSARLERQAFEFRRMADQIRNQLADQDSAIRRNYDEMRTAEERAARYAGPDAALRVAREYLERGHHTLAGDRLIEAAVDTDAIGPEAALYRGVAALLAWDREGGSIPRDVIGLPGRLAQAKAHFETVTADPDLAPLGHTGLAWIAFEVAGSERSNYALADCEAVWAAAEASALGGQVAPQALYWRAQCERKLGRVRAALRDYALAVQRSLQIQAAGGPFDRITEADRLLTMNAYHGLGTVLIATVDEPEDQELAEARALARRVCDPQSVTMGSARTRLLHACLQKAIDLRQALRQSDNQICGTRENLSFVHLRDQDFDGAYRVTSQVEATGLFAWNELMRAITADAVGERSAAAEARRHVRYFDPEQFNVCEIRQLLTPEHFELAREVLLDAHPDMTIRCT